MVLNTDKPHILAVDDDDRIRRLLAQYLTKHGYLVITAKDAAQARDILKRYEFDLCVLDVMMPGENGIDLAKYLRVSYDLPVLLLTAMTETKDKIAGLEAGADDYLAKPFEPQELLLRVQAILRRTMKTAKVEEKEAKNILQMHERSYDIGARQLMDNDGHAIALTEGEAALLYALAQKPNVPIRREMLAAQLGLDDNDRAVDVQITRLRKKIEPNSTNPSVILTLRGKGYMVKTQ
ncbi:MAG: DNA-binding response regulator [Alphaproteobacteria bacterium]|nr:MAG: DNA-binding response regulator [Alphaproteobacteria bacterium]